MANTFIASTVVGSSGIGDIAHSIAFSLSEKAG